MTTAAFVEAAGVIVSVTVMAADKLSLSRTCHDLYSLSFFLFLFFVSLSDPTRERERFLLISPKFVSVTTDESWSRSSSSMGVVGR